MNNRLKKVLACGLALVVTAGLTACDEEVPTSGNSSVGAPMTDASTTQAMQTTTDPDENAETDKEIKEIGTDTYTPDGNSGVVRLLNHYDIHGDQKGEEQCLIFESELYGGTIEYIYSGGNGDIYKDKLAAMIAADDSPDICTNEVYLNPGTVSKGIFQSLDEYIDMDSALWSGMKSTIEGMSYKGVHYYYPHRITSLYGLNYSQKTIEENNLKDPYELYLNGEWTWDAWREMMIKFCDQSEDNVGFYATDTTLTPFVATTGVPFVDVQADGTINNNLNNPEITRAMQFLEGLCRDGVMHDGRFGDWVPPATWATISDKLLFLGMEPEWTYIAASEAIQNPPGVDSDIFDTPSDFKFVPYPRDVQADKYYASVGTFGYVVPKGAKNIKGAVDFINLNRVFDTDPNTIAQVKADHCSPEKEYYVKGKYEGSQKWVITWDEQVYDLWVDMVDPTKFEFVSENYWDFNTDLNQQFAEILPEVAFRGGSWTQMSSEASGTIQAIIDQFVG